MNALAKPVLLLVGLLLAGAALRLVQLQGGAHLLAGLSASRDPSAALALVAVGTLLCAVGLPRQLVAFAAAYAFGAAIGGLLALLVQVLSCAADFAWARAVARNWAARRIAASPRLARLDDRLAARPFSATLTLRLLPVGNNLLLNLLAGVSAVPALPFLTASALGYLPQTVVFALIGSGAHVARGAQLLIGLLLFALSAAVGILLLRRYNTEGEDQERRPGLQ